MNLSAISACILDETSSASAVRRALNAFTSLCSEISRIRPDPSFDAWADDALLDSGVAINPQAAAQCVLDYRRTVVFLRGVNAAILDLQQRSPDATVEILYAGCGPFATLLLPLLVNFRPGQLNIHLLDVHQRSLDSVAQLLTKLDLADHAVQMTRADACHYQHPCRPHLVIAETMQKSLEQEPQFAVTANLAQQLSPGGVFIPQRIDIRFCLADLEAERKLVDRAETMAFCQLDSRHPLGTVLSLAPAHATQQLREARDESLTETREVTSTTVVIPSAIGVSKLDAALFTHITVFGDYCLHDYESEITLPLKCHGLPPLAGGEQVKVSYHTGSYPRFHYEVLPSSP